MSVSGVCELQVLICMPEYRVCVVLRIAEKEECLDSE